MFDLFVRYVIAVSLLQFGLHFSSLLGDSSSSNVVRIEKAAREVSRIEWRPISVFSDK